MERKSYPLFVPPDGLAATSPRAWTKREAQAYYDWLTGCVALRCTALLAFFSITDMTDPREVLRVLGAKVAGALFDDQFSCSEPSESHRRQLTNEGYAVAADMGLLVATFLIEESNGSVHWQILRRPKSDISYNLPVLAGFGKITLDPVGGSIAEASAILERRRTSDVWLQMLNFWLEKVQVT